MNLIGREMFAIDGCKLPSNAAKEWSGTRAELTRKQTKIDRAVARMLAAHQSSDDEANNTAKGVIQGYNRVAAVDEKHQIIVHAQAYGAGQEQHTLLPMFTGIDKRIRSLTPGKPERGILQRVQITADSGFHSGIPADFDYDPHSETCRCPAGKEMWLSLKGQVAGKEVIRFQGYRKACRVCPLKHQCLRNPNQQKGRQVSYYPKAAKAIPKKYQGRLWDEV